MFSLLKKYFIPHHSNDHKPHILRKASTNGALVLVLLFELFIFVLPVVRYRHLENGSLATVLPAVLASLTNKEREDEHLSDLTVSTLLSRAAQLKADDMAQKGYFAHTSPEGRTPWYWMDRVGYMYDYAGENLAINFTDSKDVTDAWMNSPTHRANIVKEDYRHMGTGIATGMYNGTEANFIVQFYARPRARVVPKPVVESLVAPEGPPAIALPQIDTTPPIPEPIPETLPGAILGAETADAVPAEAVALPRDTAPADATLVLSKPSFLDRIMVSPRHSIAVVLIAVMLVFGLAVILTIVIRFGTHHAPLVHNGLIVIIVIGALFLINRSISNPGAMVTLSMVDTRATSLYPQ